MIAPYCSALRERLRHGNIPMWVHIHAGIDAWKRAKHANATAGGCLSSVWDGKDYDWPVKDCWVRVEIDEGPTVEQCQEFAVDLLGQGAALVLLWWFDRMPEVYYQDGCRLQLEINDIREIFAHEIT